MSESEREKVRDALKDIERRAIKLHLALSKQPLEVRRLAATIANIAHVTALHVPAPPEAP